MGYPQFASVRTRPRWGLAALAGAPLLLTTMLVGTAAADHVDCGDTITNDTVLTHDLGPCLGDGLVVAADGITLNLNGHRIHALNGDGDHAGIRLAGVREVTIADGTVEGFDAGVVIRGGAGNTVRGVTARDNVNDFLTPPCLLGDGIAVLGSDDNTVEGNRLVRNGPFGGVSLVGDSDRNLIRDNEVSDNAVVALSLFCGNSQQDEGIRVEGPGADDNRIEANLVERNLLAGIGLHGHVCSEESGDELTDPNLGTVVTGNTVRGTAGTSQSSGISILQQGPATVVCPASESTIHRNVSTGNAVDGIFVAANSHHNRVDRNTVDANGRDGIHLNGPRTDGEGNVLAPGAHDNVLVGNAGRANGGYDGADLNEHCDDNRWRASDLAVVNQPCVRGPGRR